MNVLEKLGETLISEKGVPGLGVAIFRMPLDGSNYLRKESVGEFLSKPENQSGTWLIDGGWGGPPGPIHVRWNGTVWENGGFCGTNFKE